MGGVLGEGVREPFVRHPDEAVCVRSQLRRLWMSFVFVKDLSDSLSFVWRQSCNVNQSLHALIVSRCNDCTSVCMPGDDHWSLSSCDRSSQSGCIVAQGCEGNRRGYHFQTAIFER